VVYGVPLKSLHKKLAAFHSLSPKTELLEEGDGPTLGGLVAAIKAALGFGGGAGANLFQDFKKGPAKPSKLPQITGREDPTECIHRCYGRGHCIENVALSYESPGEIFECVCDEGWTGKFCQIPTDQFYLWAVSQNINVTSFTLSKQPKVNNSKTKKTKNKKSKKNKKKSGKK